jgi:hypothetical protein
VKAATIFVAENAVDALFLAKNEVYDFVLGDEECANCEMITGPVEDYFLTCAVCIADADPDEPVLLCIDCASVLILVADEADVQFDWNS